MDTANESPIGTQIRDQREALDLSIEGLAYKAGVSYKTIERIEAGGSEPRRATLHVIRAALASVQAEQEAAA